MGHPNPLAPRRFDADFVGKLRHLIFNTGTVTRSQAFDLATKQGRAIDIIADNLMRPLIGVGDPALQLGRGHVFREKTERRRRCFTRLHLQLGQSMVRVSSVPGCLFSAVAGEMPTDRGFPPA